MSAPTARELLEQVEWGYGAQVVGTLAARVDALIARAEYLSKHGAAGPFVEEVLRLLNGKQP